MARPIFPLDLSLSPFQRANSYISHALEASDTKYYGYDVTARIKLVDVSLRDEKKSQEGSMSPTWTVAFELLIPSELCVPSFGTLHGGAVATIFDVATSSVINAAAQPGFWENGNVSRTLSCSYLRPVRVGEKIRIDCEAVSLGKRNALIRGVVRRLDSNGRIGQICYTCEHEKIAIGKPQNL